MISQMKRRHQVSGSSDVIMARQTRMPKIGNKGKYGTRKDLGISGWVLRKTMTPAQTMIKANNVPMDVMLPNLEIGKNPAKKPTKTIKSKFERHGVRHWGWMSEKSLGKSPSRDMA